MSGKFEGEKGFGAKIDRWGQKYMCEVMESDFELGIMQSVRVLGITCGSGVFPREEE